MDFQEQVYNLWNEQTTNWTQLTDNYKGLKDVKSRYFEFDGFKLEVQYNPRRIESTAAKVDKQSLEKRPCFLCETNRSNKQKGVVFNERFEVLCNPFPIFTTHFTIAMRQHLPQAIDGLLMSDMLALSKSLPDFVILYNAPDCGASAPDHMHFQAGNYGFMPFDDELDRLIDKYGKQVKSNNSSSVFTVNDGLRPFVLIESSVAEDVIFTFLDVLKSFTVQGSTGEPMINILTYFRNDRWRVAVFLRKRHRPHHYFEQDEKQLLISPGAADMGGIITAPRIEDFNKITKQHLIEIFDEVMSVL